MVGGLMGENRYGGGRAMGQIIDSYSLGSNRR